MGTENHARSIIVDDFIEVLCRIIVSEDRFEERYREMVSEKEGKVTSRKAQR